MKENLTAKALELMKNNPEMTVYAAAMAVGIKPTTLYAGVARAEKRGALTHCSRCHQPIDGLKRLVQAMKDELAKGVDPTTAEWIADAEKLLGLDPKEKIR